METILRKLENISLQRKRLNKETPKGDVIVCSLWRHKEMGRNDPSPSFEGVTILDNNDPCMLRHTAGCSFYQGQCINEVVHLKPTLIDLNTYDYAEAA